MPSTINFLRLLADPTRLRLLLLLEQEELSVAELQDILGMGQSRISSHLAQLKRAGVVADRRAGKNVYYGLTNDQKLDPQRAKVSELTRVLDRAVPIYIGYPDEDAGEEEAGPIFDRLDVLQREGIEQAVALMQGYGARRFAFLAGKTNSLATQSRERMVRKVIAERGLPPPILIQGDYMYDTAYRETRHVNWDGYIEVRGNRYSVPHGLQGRVLAVRIGLDESLRVYDGEALVATHRLRSAREGWVTVPAHHEALWQTTLGVQQRSLAAYEEAAAWS